MTLKRKKWEFYKLKLSERLVWLLKDRLKSIILAPILRDLNSLFIERNILEPVLCLIIGTFL